MRWGERKRRGREGRKEYKVEGGGEREGIYVYEVGKRRKRWRERGKKGV